MCHPARSSLPHLGRQQGCGCRWADVRRVGRWDWTWSGECPSHTGPRTGSPVPQIPRPHPRSCVSMSCRPSSWMQLTLQCAAAPAAFRWHHIMQLGQDEGFLTTGRQIWVNPPYVLLVRVWSRTPGPLARSLFFLSWWIVKPGCLKQPPPGNPKTTLNWRPNPDTRVFL